jgi:rod shape-determining protein MreD
MSRGHALTDTAFMARTFPKLALGLAIVVTAIPLGLPGDAAFALPLAAMMLVFIFSSFKLPPIRPWFVFLAGLVMDVLTAGPFGFWALVFLMAYCFGRAIAPYGPGLGPIGLWLAFIASACAIGACGWAVASLYFMRLLDPYPMGLGLAAVVLAYPFVAWALERLVRIGQPAGNLSFRG